MEVGVSYYVDQAALKFRDRPASGVHHQTQVIASKIAHWGLPPIDV